MPLYFERQVIKRVSPSILHAFGRRRYFFMSCRLKQRHVLWFISDGYRCYCLLMLLFCLATRLAPRSAEIRSLFEVRALTFFIFIIYLFFQRWSYNATFADMYRDLSLPLCSLHFLCLSLSLLDIVRHTTLYKKQDKSHFKVESLSSWVYSSSNS